MTAMADMIRRPARARLWRAVTAQGGLGQDTCIRDGETDSQPREGAATLVRDCSSCIMF